MASTRLKNVKAARRARVLSSRPSKLMFTDFVPTKKTISGRVCEFLYAMSKKYPEVVILFEELVQAVEQLSSRPSPNAPRVKQLRRAMAHPRRVMRRDYGCDIILTPGVGLRATATQIDFTKNIVLRDTHRVDQAINKLQETIEMVNDDELKLEIAQLPNSTELRELGEWYANELKVGMLRLENGRKNIKLLPQGEADAKSGNK